MIKKTPSKEFIEMKQSGNALKMKNKEKMVGVYLDKKSDSIILASQNGFLIKFKHADVNPSGRIGIGVKGLNLQGEDKVTFAMLCTETNGQDDVQLTGPEGKSVSLKIDEIKEQGRAGKGIKIKFK